MSATNGDLFGLPIISDEERRAYRWALSMRHDELWRREQQGDWYATYLESDLWARTRDLALEYYGPSCCLCNKETTRINVHHRTYERIGRERLSDLIVLCRDCHARYHRKAA